MSKVDAPLPVPEGLATMPPGPELAAALAEVGVATVSGFDTVEVLKAEYRQQCHDRARFLLALVETGLRQVHSGNGVVRAEVPDEHASDEARAALAWSRRRADSAFGLAWDVHYRLPLLGEAMLAGDLDEPRAVAFVQWTTGLTDDQALTVCAQLLPRAMGWTVGELITHIQRLAMSIDPEWAEKRYQEAVKTRRVVGSRNPDGSATVSGLNLPVENAVAGCERIDALAKKCKKAGDARRIDHIRADVYLGLLDGSFERMSEDEIVARILARPLVDDDENDGNGTSDGNADDGNPGDGAPGGSQGGPAGGAPHGGPSVGGSSSGGSSSGGSGGPGAGATVPGSESTAASDGDAASDGVPEPTGDVRGRGVREVRMELTTVLGLDAHPGDIPGWGLIAAAAGRKVVASMPQAQWRFAICDAAGRLLVAGVTRRRPHTWAGSAAAVRPGGIVELQVKLHVLSDLADAVANGQYGEWAAVITDLMAAAEGAGIAKDADTAEDVRRADSGGSDAATVPECDVRRRTANAGLRRWVEIRDRVCAFPGCRMPAAQTDQDHRVDYAKGGLTTANDLNSACRHDHMLKTGGLWQLVSVRSGDGGELIGVDAVAEWISPMGQRYPVRPRPIMISVLLPRSRAYGQPGRATSGQNDSTSLDTIGIARGTSLESAGPIMVDEPAVGRAAADGAVHKGDINPAVSFREHAYSQEVRDLIDSGRRRIEQDMEADEPPW